MTAQTYYARTWFCMCTQVEAQPELLPDRCDHHDRAALIEAHPFPSDGLSDTGHACCSPGLQNDPRTLLRLGAVA